MNILKIQDTLKNLSDEQLAQEMRLPSGSAPQYLVMTEMQRRQKMRAEFSGQEPPKTTMAEEMSGEAPPQPPARPEGGAPQEANAQGIMGLPDQTMAGGAMRAMISGQPQQVDDMTAMPPQGMAAGGAVQFGNPFAGAQMGAAAAPSAGYSPIQQYSAKYYAPKKGDDYGDIRHQFDGRPPPHTPNPRVYKSDAERYGLPAGMAAPTPGTPGFEKISSGREGGNARYSWSDPSYRDAYIRYMTPPAKATAPVAKAGGGPIRMAGGEDVPTVGGPETSAFEDWWNSIGFTPGQVQAVPAAEREAYINRLRQDPRVTGFNPAGNPKYEQEVQSFLDREILRAKAEMDAARNSPPMFGSLFTPRGEVERRAKAREEALAERDRLSGQVPSTEAPLPVLSGRDIPGAVEAVSQYQPPTRLAPADDVGRGTNAPIAQPAGTGGAGGVRRPAPMSAPVSGPSDKAANKGIASLPQGPKGMSYEDYMRQANELISGGREDEGTAKDRAFNNALIQLGLGMANSKNQSTLGAIAEGGIPALQGYTEAEAQRRKDDRALVGERLATLGVGAQMSQAEAKAADDRAHRAEQAAIQRDEIAARREDARLTAAYRDNDLALKRLTLDAEVAARERPEKVVIWEQQYGKGGAQIGVQVEAMENLMTVLNDGIKEASAAAGRGVVGAEDRAAKLQKQIDALALDYANLTSLGTKRQPSTNVGPLPTAQKGQFVLNP